MSPDTGERWNVNMPAVVGVVFAFLVGVIAWVVISSGGEDPGDATADTTTTAATVAATTAPPADTGVTGTTTPAPMPDLSATTAPMPPTTAPVPPTAPPTNPPTSPPPPTTAPGAEPGAPLGDLAIAGRPMQSPPCNDSYITILASAVGDQATAAGLTNVLDAYPGSSYLRTDQTCPSLNPDVDGAPIYVVYFGPFIVASDACVARADGPEGAYARQLSEDLGPNHTVDCT